MAEEIFEDVVHFLNVKAEPGHAVFERWSRDNEKWYTGFFVFEDRKHLNKLSKYPRFNVRAGLITYGDRIGVIVIMWRINYNYELLYETMLNIHSDSGKGIIFLNNFCNQDEILFHFYEGYDRRRSIKITNEMKSEFQKIKAEVEKPPAWSMSEFDQAKARVYRDFKTPNILFNALEPNKNFYLFN